MVNEEIVAGLKSALERGQPLQKAMMALYNSGYKKEEIEEAARSLMEFSAEAQLQPPVKTVPKRAEIKQAPQVLTTPQTVKSFPELQPSQPIKPMPQLRPLTPMPRPFIQPRAELQIPKQPLQIPATKLIPVQKISNYGQQMPKEKTKEKGTSREKAIILVLVFLLIFLIGLLGAIFIFKEQLIDFFSTFFAK